MSLSYHMYGVVANCFTFLLPFRVRSDKGAAIVAYPGTKHQVYNLPSREKLSYLSWSAIVGVAGHIESLLDQGSLLLPHGQDSEPPSLQTGAWTPSQLTLHPTVS